MMDNRELRERLSALRGSRAVILGVGNVLKGDDGTGPLVCEALQGTVSAKVIDAGTVPENYIRPVIDARPQVLLVADAVDFGGCPGAIGVFRPDQINDAAFSTHALSLRLFVDVLRQDIEVDVLVLGIQPGSTRLGAPVSSRVEGSIQLVTDALREVFPVADRSTERSPDTSSR